MTDNMGNKNARGNTAMDSHQHQMKTSTLPNASSEGSSISNNRKTEATSGIENDKIKNKPAPLAFRSYQTGTLHAPPFELNTSAPAQKTIVKHKKALSATSPVFVPASLSGNNSPSMSPIMDKLMTLLSPIATSNSGLSSSAQTPGTAGALTLPTSSSSSGRQPIGVGYDRVGRRYEYFREIITREDKNRKDVVIEYDRVYRNIVCLHEVYDASGNLEYVDSGDYAYGNYYIEYDLEQMSQKERAAFWTSNWVEIVVDIDNFNMSSDLGYTEQQLSDICDKKMMNIVNVMNELGPDFATYTRTIFITMKFPEESATQVPEYLLQTLKEQMESRAYRALQNICNKLKEFTALQRLEIILRTQAHSRNPVALAQLHYALPFYELPFTNWQLKWQNTYMSHPETVRGWPITHLDIERSKIDRELARAQQDKERAEDKVYVHASASPAVHDLPFAPRGSKPKSG